MLSKHQTGQSTIEMIVLSMVLVPFVFIFPCVFIILLSDHIGCV